MQGQGTKISNSPREETDEIRAATVLVTAEPTVPATAVTGGENMDATAGEPRVEEATPEEVVAEERVDTAGEEDESEATTTGDLAASCFRVREQIGGESVDSFSG